jgi:hypothetical protein
MPAAEVSQTQRSGSKSKRRFGLESTDPGAILRVSERISSIKKAVSWSQADFTGILRAHCSELQRSGTAKPSGE